LALMGACGAPPDDCEMGEMRFVAEQLSDAIANWIELRGGHGPNGTAMLAREKLVLTAADEDVKPRTVAEMHMLGEAVLLERF
jgi:hypothetical protein